MLTERELNAIGRHFDGYVSFSPLVAKINGAFPAMREAKRLKNRANKIARKAREAAKA
jgi:hypothetical protein